MIRLRNLDASTRRPAFVGCNALKLYTVWLSIEFTPRQTYPSVHSGVNLNTTVRTPRARHIVSQEPGRRLGQCLTFAGSALIDCNDRHDGLFRSSADGVGTGRQLP